MKGMPMHDNEERLPNKEAINMAAIARISQDKGHRPQLTDPEEEGEHHPTAARPSRGAETSAPQSSRIEDTMMKEFQKMQQEQRDYWSYVAARDKAMQKNIKANSRCFHTFLAFPEHIFQPLEAYPSDDK